MQELVAFAGISLDNHVYPRKYLEQEKSIKNTNLKKMNPERNQEVAYIEIHLREYLYPFEKYK